MDTANVEVVRAEAVREEINYGNPDIAEALATLAPTSAAFRLPLAKVRVTVEVKGVPAAAANALRRALAGEHRGRCLTFDRNGFRREETTDPFMADDDFVRTRFRMIPLRPQIPAETVRDLRLALHAANTTDEVLTLYSGDLEVAAGSLPGAIFNPTHELAFLQPGRTLHIENIRIAEGFAHQDAAFASATRAGLKPLDIGEHPREATHSRGGSAAEQSGFVQSSLVANPRHHRVTCYIPAAPENPAAALSVVVDACAGVMERLRYIQGVLDAALARSAAAQSRVGLTHRGSNAYFLVTPGPDRTKGVLVVKNETATVGNLLARSVYELMPDVAFAAYTCAPHEKTMRLTVEHTVPDPADVGGIVLRAVKHAYAIFATIQRGVREHA